MTWQGPETCLLDPASCGAGGVGEGAGWSRARYRHLVDKGQNAAKHPTGQGQPHTTKNYLSKMFFGLVWAVLAFHCCSGFSLVVVSGRLLPSCGARSSHCGGFSCCGAQTLVCGPSSCGAKA